MLSRSLKVNLLLLLFINIASAQNIPTPKQHFGFAIGDNYQLATFTQTEAYFKKLGQASDKARYTVIGKTEEGRDQFMLIVTSAANQQKLQRYQEISQKMGSARIGIEEAMQLTKEGKAVVWIDGGLHATETVGIHQLIETAYQLLSRNDDETKRILDDVIILMTHANPDGQELVSNWYMREPDTLKRSVSGLPRLYQKYVGHDNNRDFYMLHMKETQNIGRQLFVDWIPQIMYNHHQSGPAGSVVAGAPYRDPFNYVFDPLIITGLDAIGAAMQNRLNAENKPGYTSKAGSVFSTWYNGGLRTTTYFHNMLGLLTEIIGNPTPSDVPLVTSRLIPNAATPNPVTPGKWLFKQSIEYSVSLNYAVLDFASRNRDALLMNMYRMGRNSIERGSKDTWSLSPSKIEKIKNYYIDSVKAAKKRNTDKTDATINVPNIISARFYDSVMKDPALKDPRGYIIPADQADLATAIVFLNALIKTGIEVQKATAGFNINEKKYAAGSYIVKTDQAFRPHVLDMFEPQDHPNDFQYPGGPPVSPYDAAGWTPAYQMGIKFDRITEPFNGPFIQLPLGQQITENTYPFSVSANGYVVDAAANNSFKAVNALLKKNIPIYRLALAPENAGYSNGSFYIPHSTAAASAVAEVNKNISVSIVPAEQKPARLQKMKKARIALWDNYGGSMPSGWVRWLMEQFDYDFEVIYAKEIDNGNLRNKYDVIVFVGGAIPAPGSREGGTRDSSNIPAEYKNRIGRISASKSIPQLKTFLEEGGNIITIGSSTQLAYHLKIPVSDAMVDIENGKETALDKEKFYTPGSILQVAVDKTQPANAGMESKPDIYFDESPVFRINPEAISTGTVTPLAWFDTDKPLRSGWAWGQAYLKNGVAAFQAKLGKGKLYAFGPEITFRAQAYGSFKWLFNQLYQ